MLAKYFIIDTLEESCNSLKNWKGGGKSGNRQVMWRA